MKEKMGAMTYSKHCPQCLSIVRLTVDEINFNGVTTVPCPVCHGAIKFTGDYGKILGDVSAAYEKEFRQFYARRKENKRRQNQTND